MHVDSHIQMHRDTPTNSYRHLHMHTHSYTLKIKCVIHTKKTYITFTKSSISFEAGYSGYYFMYYYGIYYGDNNGTIIYILFFFFLLSTMFYVLRIRDI